MFDAAPEWWFWVVVAGVVVVEPFGTAVRDLFGLVDRFPGGSARPLV
jgi:hypothetical protein